MFKSMALEIITLAFHLKVGGMNPASTLRAWSLHALPVHELLLGTLVSSPSPETCVVG